jgi:uncharacterized membrane protein YdjX (TVP38/TMEM64 family)
MARTRNENDWGEAVGGDRGLREGRRGGCVSAMAEAPELATQRKIPARWRWGWVLGAVAVAGIVAWLGRDWPVRAGVEAGLAAVRAAGPGWYFAAMAVVPLPLAWFTVPAGEAFAAQLTLGGVIAAALGAVAVQLALSYAVARYALRPAIERLVRRRGLAVPRVTAANALSVALLVRLTPGPPMVLGSCVLAVAEMPFGRYLLVSWLVALPWVLGGVVLGRGALAGDFKLLVAGAGVLVAAAVAVRWARKKWAARGAV